MTGKQEIEGRTGEEKDMSRIEASEHIENSKLALKILAYFRNHPEAKDSVQGIAKWWVQDNPYEVRQVLEKLVGLDLVGKRSNPYFDYYFAPNNGGNQKKY